MSTEVAEYKLPHNLRDQPIFRHVIEDPERGTCAIDTLFDVVTRVYCTEAGRIEVLATQARYELRGTIDDKNQDPIVFPARLTEVIISRV